MRRSLKRVGRVAVAAAAVTAVTAVGPSPASADPVDDQRARVERITDELARLEERSSVLAEDYVTALDELKRFDADVAAAQQRVTEQEAAVASLRGELSEVAVRAYMGAGTNGFGAMFSDSSAVTASLQRDQLSRVALSAGTATTDELDQAIADLQDERDALERKQEEAAAKAEQVEEARKATDEQKVEYQEARREAEAELGRRIQEEEERRARESYARMQREAEQAAARQAAASQQAQARAQAAPASGGGGGGNSGGGGGGGEVAAAPRPAPVAPAIPAASSRAGTAINAALSQVGVGYRYATAEPGVAFDCSGLTSWAWGQAGVGLPHQSRAQQASVPNVPKDAAQPGDLLFFYSPISHVSIYLGGGQHVHARNPGTTVTVAAVNWGSVVAVGRPG
jgi:cell wall-associated NlpC family hydrolase